MSDEHKAALARGRREARALKSYLQALAARKPGRPASPERIKERIAALEQQIAVENDPLKALDLRQRRLDDEAALARLSAEEDMDALEQRFVEHARSYSERKGISYAAWREQGVPPAVLKASGIARTRAD